MLKSPVSLGLGPKWKSWRNNQDKAVLEIVNALETFDYAALSAPTGFGKTAVETAIGQVMRELGDARRVQVNVVTNALLDQLCADTTHALDIKGRSNYRCKAHMLGKFTNCEQGADHDCQYIGESRDCTYESRRDQCTLHHTVYTNYAWKISNAMYSNAIGVGPFDLTIMDEAHLIPGEITRMLNITLTERDQWEICRDLGVSAPTGLHSSWPQLATNWVQWYGDTYTDEDDGTDRGPKDLQVLLEKCKRMKRSSGDANWLTYVRQGEDGRDDPNVYTDVIWPGMYFKSLLQPYGGKALLTSASLTPKIIANNGIKKDECYYRSWPSVFNPERWPGYWIRTARMKQAKHMAPQDIRRWVDTMDEIVYTRAKKRKRNGVIHIHSYGWAKLYYQLSQYKEHLIVPNKASTRVDIENFRKLKCTGRVLVHPAVTTGYDFPGDECRWVIVAKVPYTYAKDPLTVARLVKDKRYLDNEIGQSLSQMSSRGMRGESDWCEVFFVDDMIDIYCRQNSDLLADWFPLYNSRGYMRVVSDVPAPMTRWEN